MRKIIPYNDNDPVEIACAADTLLDALADMVKRERSKLILCKEALTEMAKPPYEDSDLSSLMQWVNARAKQVLNEVAD